MKFNLSLENINYIKITYRDPEGVGHVAKAVIKQLSSVDILACMKYEDSVKIPYPQDVQVSIACDNALYKANTTLKFVESDDLYVYFTRLVFEMASSISSAVRLRVSNAP